MTTLDKVKQFVSTYFVAEEIDSRHTFIRDEIQGRVDSVKNTLLASAYTKEFYAQTQNKIPASKKALLNDTVLPYLSKFTNMVISGTVSVIAWPLSLFNVKSFTTKAAQEKTHEDLQRQNGLFTTLGVVSFTAVYDWFVSLRTLVLLGALYGTAKLGLDTFRGTAKTEAEEPKIPASTGTEDIESDPKNPTLNSSQLRKRGGVKQKAKVNVEVEKDEESVVEKEIDIEKKVEVATELDNLDSAELPKASSGSNSPRA